MKYLFDQKKPSQMKFQNFSLDAIELPLQVTESIRKLAPIILALLMGAVLGLLVLRLPFTFFILLLIGMAILLVSFYRPELIVLLIIGVNSTIFALNQIPSIRVGLRFSAVELCLFYLFAFILVQLLVDKNKPYVRTPLDLPIALFFLASFISFLYSAIYLGTNVNLMEYQWRIFFGYMIFFVITNLVRSQSQLRTLFVGLMILGGIVAVLMIVQQALGPSVKILPGRVETATVFENRYDQVTRILPPGLSLILVLIFPSLLLLLSSERINGKSFLLFLLTSLLLVAEAFTFNRGTWGGLLVAGLAIFLRVATPIRFRMVTLIGLIIAIGVGAYLLFASFYPRIALITNALQDRMGALINTEKAINDPSWEWRIREINQAWEKIDQNPIVGIGPGNNYRSKWFTGDGLTAYIHNAYVFLLLDFGLVGIIPFVWFSGLFLLRGFLLYPKIKDKFYQSISLGFTAAYGAILIAGVAAPIFSTWYWPLVLGTMFGINEVVYQFNNKGEI